MFVGSVGSRPTIELSLPVIAFVSMNSINAIDFSWLRIVKAFGGEFIYQSRINTRNCNKFTKFHKYFKPNDSRKFSIRFNVAKDVIPEAADDSSDCSVFA